MVVKRTAMKKGVRFFFAMYSTSIWNHFVGHKFLFNVPNKNKHMYDLIVDYLNTFGIVGVPIFFKEWRYVTYK